MRDTDRVVVLPQGVARYYAALGMLAILRFRHQWTPPPVGVIVRGKGPASSAFESFRSILNAVADELRSAPGR